MTNILRILIDGKEHTVKEIKQKTELDENQIQQVIEFLERYGFISVDKMTRKIVLDKTVQKFLAQETNS
ncbi:hypothetical protein E3J49_05665 [Candidatus Bathyarchaeota archaeon]|nr:MAG: hypothetical protein E3J49_05665 [Candidatus Bathyarchaeota archaeon]